MRILYVSHLLSPEEVDDNGNSVAGAQSDNPALITARAAVAAGHEVAVYLRSRQSGKDDETEERSDRFPGLHVVESYVGKKKPSQTLRVRRGQEDRFRAFCADWKPDVVHFYSLLYHSFAYPAITRAAGAATVLTLTDFYFSCPKRDRILYNSEPCVRLPEYTCLPCFWHGGLAAILPVPAVDTLIRLPLLTHLFDLYPVADDLDDWAPAAADALRFMDIVLSDSPAFADDLRAQGIWNGTVTSLMDDTPAAEPNSTSEAEQEPFAAEPAPSFSFDALETVYRGLVPAAHSEPERMVTAAIAAGTQSG